MGTTRSTRQFAGLVAAGIVFVALTDFTARADEKPEPVTIKKVLSVKLSTAQRSLKVSAVGEVPTGGFTKPALARVQYIKPPDDGIQDYSFTAVPPDGPAIQVISQVQASDTWGSLPDWVKGVRIHGVGDGVLVKMLREK